MRKLSIFTALLIMLSINFVYSQNVAINDDGTAPANSAILDLNTTAGDKGLLIPRIDLDDASTATPVTSPAEGLIVYNETGTETHGFYYWNGTAWNLIVTTGTALWTRDATNGYTYLTNATDKIGIGTSTPNEQLEITGNFRMPLTTATSGIIYSDGVRFLHTFGGTNTFCGRYSGNFSMSGAESNVGIGYYALSFLTSGDDNIAIGRHAGSSIITGKQNVAIGSYALTRGALWNVAIGHKCLQNATGSSNTGLGRYALLSTTSGSNNVAIGKDAGNKNNIGEANVLLGTNTNYGNQTGNSNTIIGYLAGSSTNIHNKSENVFIGSESGVNARGGCDANVFIGFQSGYTNETGTNNVFLGNMAGYNETGSNKLFIENSNSATPLIYGEFDNDIIKINGTFIKANDVIADNDATPDVSAKNVWTYNGTANSVIVTDLGNPEIGAIYTIIGNSDTHTITINDIGNFNLSANWTGAKDDVITIYVQADNDYIEISRIDN